MPSKMNQEQLLYTDVSDFTDGDDLTNSTCSSSAALVTKHNHSTQDGNEGESSTQQSETYVTPEIPKWRRYLAVGVLFYISVLNYIDRYTIAGILNEITDTFQIDNSKSGLIQTVFLVGYLIVSPLFGYLGDRCNRTTVLVVGIVIWSGSTLCSSFVHTPETFYIFLILRAVVGVGEASYIAISPTLIADMFVGPERTRMLGIFFSSVPIGCGLGYVVGSAVSNAFGGWQWALRVTPIFGVVGILLLILVLPNLSRGASETHILIDQTNKSSFKDDLLYLLKCKSFVMLALGSAFTFYMIGSLTLWGPTYLAYSQIVVGKLSPCHGQNCSYVDISLHFGISTSLGGLCGVLIGSEIARRWKKSGRLDADPLVCSIGVLSSTILILFGFCAGSWSYIFSIVLIFLAITTNSFIFALTGDIALYVVEPCRRSTATSVAMFVSHLLGDAGSPYFTGLIADRLADNQPDSYVTKYLSLQYALFVSLFMCVIGGSLFLMMSLFIVEDKEKVDKKMADMRPMRCPMSDSMTDTVFSDE